MAGLLNESELTTMPMLTAPRRRPPTPCDYVQLDACIGSGHALWFSYKNLRLCRTCLRELLDNHQSQSVMLPGGLVVPQRVADLIAKIGQIDQEESEMT